MQEANFFSKTGIFGFSKETTGSEGNAGGTTAGIGGREEELEDEGEEEGGGKTGGILLGGRGLRGFTSSDGS